MMLTLEQLGSTWGLLVGGDQGQAGRRWRRRPRSPGQACRDTAVPGAGRLAGWSLSICRACSRSPKSLGLARPKPVTVQSQVQRAAACCPSTSASGWGSTVARPPVQVRALRGDRGLPARDGRGVHQPQHLRAARRVIGQPPQCRLISGASALRRSLYSDWPSSRGNRCPTCLAAARSQCRSSS